MKELSLLWPGEWFSSSFFPSSFIQSLGAGRGRGRGSGASPSPISLRSGAARGVGLCSPLRFPAQGGKNRWVPLWSGRGIAELTVQGWGLGGVGTAGKPPAWLGGSFSAPPSSCSGNEAAVGREEARSPPWRRLRPQHRLSSSDLGPISLRGEPLPQLNTLSIDVKREKKRMYFFTLSVSANVGANKTCLALPMVTWKAGTCQNQVFIAEV